MLVRHIQQEEYARADLIKHIAFGRLHKAPPNDADDPAAIYQSVVVCCDDDGTITARARNIDYLCAFDGQWVRMSGVSGVASLPEARGRGRVRALMRFMLEDDRQNGVLFSTLRPFSHAYYRRFGYELTCSCHTVTLPTDSLRTFASLPFSARMHEQGDYEQLREVTRRFGEGYNLAILPTDRQYLKALGGDALHHGDYRYLLFTPEGDPCAFLHYTDGTTKDGRCCAELQLLEFVDEQALRCVLGFLYGLRARYECVSLPLPVEVDLCRWLDEPQQATILSRPHGMARIVDVARVLTATRHPEGTGHYILEVADELLEDNAGRYRVDYQNGVAIVSQTQDAADLNVDIASLTQLVLGYATVDDLLYKPTVTLFGKGDVLRHVFPRKRVFLSYPF